MKTFLYPLVGLVLASSLGACVTIDTTTSKPPSSSSTTPVNTGATPPASNAPAAPEPSPISLTGTGKQATQKFNLEAGLAVVKATHKGSGYFGAWLLDSAGDKKEMLGNGVGVQSTSKTLGMKTAGEYLIDVSADGEWTFDITQPRPQAADATRSFSGSAAQAAGPFSLSGGLTKFTFSHAGDGYFGAWLVDKDGNKKEMIANGIGKVEGSKAAGVTAGIYYLDVTGNGAWSIVLE